MNRFLSISIFLFLAILVPGALFAQSSAPDSLTMQEAISLTLQNHPVIQQAISQEQAAAAGIGSSRSYYYPDISVKGNYTRIGPVTKIDLPTGSISLFPADNYDIHVALNQMIYDFGRRGTGVKAARAGQMSAADYIKLAKSNLAYSTIMVFNSILILEQSISVLDEQISSLNQHLEASRKKVEAGTATDFDVLTTQVRIALTRDRKIDAQKSLEARLISLHELTGLPSEKVIDAKGEFYKDSLELDQDSLLALAEKQRPEMILARDAESSAEIRLQLASLGNRPSLLFNFTGGIKDGYYPNLYRRKANYTAGLLLNVPIFNGRLTHYQSAQARANLEAAKAHTREIGRQITSEVNTSIEDVQSSFDKIQNAMIQVKHAEDALSMAKVQYEAGVITNLELLDTQTALSEARLSLLQAQYAYTVSIHSLDKATGKKTW
jgi:outer membrane protein